MTEVQQIQDLIGDYWADVYYVHLDKISDLSENVKCHNENISQLIVNFKIHKGENSLLFSQKINEQIRLTIIAQHYLIIRVF